jgi:ABC-2 type transport system ATP-binding protein
VSDLPGVGREVRVAGSVVEVRTDTPTADVATLATWASHRGAELDALTLARPSLEDVYLDLVGEPDAVGDRVDEVEEAPR